MTSLPQAIGRAAIVRAGFNSVERRLQEAVDLAIEAGRPDIADRLSAALSGVEAGHVAANEAAALIAAHYGEPDVSVLSGPEDKPDPDPVP